jgi:hypothetical protein
MAARTYKTYEDAAQDYLAEFSGLMRAPKGPAEGTARGAAELPADHLIRGASRIADISSNMLIKAQPYLNSPNPSEREGISLHLLSQASAELQLATELLHVAAEGQGGTAPTMVSRAARGVSLGQAVSGLEQSMQHPVSAGLAAYIPARRAMTVAPGDAKQALQTSVGSATGAISQRVIAVGADIATDLVLQTQWSAVLDGAQLLHNGLAAKLDQVKQGASAIVEQAVTAAEKTLLNVYDKILALLGKDIQDQARKQIQDWLTQIKQTGSASIFKDLVANLYQVSAFQQDLQGWMTTTTAPLDQIGQASAQVDSLAAKFDVLASQAGTLENVVGMAKMIKIPQVLLVVAALQVALLAVVVYAGYDYIGYKQQNIIDITKGVAQVVEDVLGIKR